MNMEVAHVIPFLLNNFDDRATSSSSIVRYIFSSSCLTHFCIQKVAAITWDMLRSWTRIDFETLIGSKINSPTNAIYMSKQEHFLFGRFDFYLDKDAVRQFHGGLFQLTSGLTPFSIRITPTNTEYAWFEERPV